MRSQTPGGAPPQASDGRRLPSRDELTQAWGDRILGRLDQRVRAYLSPGRFVAVEDGHAVFALPDQGFLTRAQGVAGAAEAAIADAFGRPVPLRFILDTGGPRRSRGDEAPPPPEPPPDDHDADDYDPASFTDAGPAVVSPEQRLLEAFPGAEEVDQ